MRELPEQGKEPYSFLVSGELNDTKLAFLIDTGANTNIISYDTLFSLDIPVQMEKYTGRLVDWKQKTVNELTLSAELNCIYVWAKSTLTLEL